MSKKLNPKAKDARINHKAKRLAGGLGMKPARQGAEALLRRAVLANLLWEDVAYQSGKSITNEISKLVPTIDFDVVADIAVEARVKQKLRHIPLFLLVELTKHPQYARNSKLLRSAVREIVSRPDMMTDLLALYWKSGRRNPSKKVIPSQMKLGLADAFENFDEYQFGKWDRDGEIKLRDVIRLIHPKPKTQDRSVLYGNVKERTVKTPDTWEVALSAGEDKKEAWERLILDKKIPALAFLKNIRNMTQAGVQGKIVRQGLKNLKSQFLLPLNFLNAVEHAPTYKAEIEDAMLRVYSSLPKLPGFTVFVMDVSGSMGSRVSAKSQSTRLTAGFAMAALAREQCESVAIYATAGDDGLGRHKTKRVANSRGFSLIDELEKQTRSLGGGGIFTRQCLEYIQNDLDNEEVDRIIVFSDSQDCDRTNKIPKPFGTYNYIVDVSSHTNGVNYNGAWTAEISGWSEHFLSFIAASEGLNLQQQDDQ